MQFDFSIDGVRYRPTLPWIPHEANLRRAREHLPRIKTRIATGTFTFTEDFPTSGGLIKAIRTALSGSRLANFAARVDARREKQQSFRE
jgi:hypothetical protein